MRREVHTLIKGMLFTLPCEGHKTLYSFVRNEYRDGSLDQSLVMPIAGWWPKGSRGDGIPGHWCYNERSGETNCNPYAEALLAFPRDKDSE